MMLAAVVVALCLYHTPVWAQAEPAGAIAGVAVTGDGIVMPGLLVTAEASTGATLPGTTTDGEGRFRFEPVVPGVYEVVGRTGDGLGEARATITVLAGAVARVELLLQLGFSERVVVTDARGARLKRETPATVGTLTRDTLEDVRPTHPSEVMGLIPGVWVNVTGGEGHQTAIRQPLTTNPVYLYLEDGVPTRSTGFFNHNALYEINVPAAEGIEVTKGPGSALYGSDAIGGVVNVLTRSSLGEAGADVTAESGQDGWRRVVAGGSWTTGRDGVRADVNLTGSDGYRDATGYDRQSATIRFDRARTDSALKVLLSANLIDQQTAGSSSLSEVDYLTSPETNLTPISLRGVEAYRVSLDYQRTIKDLSLSLVPYFRYDSMELLPNWTLTFDPTIYTTDNTSWGVLAKVERALPQWRTSLMAGLDVDFSPGGRVEDVVVLTTSASGLPSGRRIFSGYTVGNRVYDYDVTFLSMSPYAQVEISPTPRSRLSLGLRVDRMQYEYDDRLTVPDTARHRRPADGSRSFGHVSPKLGWTYQLSDAANVFASYRHAFRAPAEGQLFRQGSAVNTFDLDPVRADNVEAGLRVTAHRRLGLDLSLYQLDKRDDILSFRDPLDGATQSVNAGHTRHRGVELGVEASPASPVHVRLAYTYATHTYQDWLVDPRAGVDYSGKEQETAPRQIGTLTVRVSPVRALDLAVEAAALGSYWLDAANTTKYGGHMLVNLRGQYAIGRGLRVFAKVLNLADRLYAESGSYTLARGREFAPGRPRTAFAGVEWSWRP